MWPKFRGCQSQIFCYQSIQFMDRQLQHRSRSRDLRRRPKAAIHGRRRPRAAIGQRPRRDRRRPKAGVGACRASRARTRTEAPIQDSGKKPEKAPSTRPCVFRRLYAPATPCFFPAAPYGMPWRLCDLPKYPAALTTNRNRLRSPTSVRYFWAQEQQPFPGTSQRRPLPGNAHPAPLSPYSTSTSLSRPL